jgi:hypothetical protein
MLLYQSVVTTAVYNVREKSEDLFSTTRHLTSVNLCRINGCRNTRARIKYNVKSMEFIIVIIKLKLLILPNRKNELFTAARIDAFY